MLAAPGPPLDPADPEVGQLCADLVATMRVSPGCVGLAAPQIGVPGQAFCVDVSEHPKTRTRHGLIVLVNAEVTTASRYEKGREGCMSVPDLTGDVKRATRLTVTGLLPLTGEPVSDHAPTPSRPGRCSTRSTTAPACCSWTGWPAPTRSSAARSISSRGPDRRVRFGAMTFPAQRLRQLQISSAGRRRCW